MKRQITFSAAPQIVDETLWIPLLDTITLLGMDAYWNVDSNGSPMLYIHYPERTALDILADLYDDSYRSNVIFSFPEELDKSLTQMAIGAAKTPAPNPMTLAKISSPRFVLWAPEPHFGHFFMLIVF